MTDDNKYTSCRRAYRPYSISERRLNKLYPPRLEILQAQIMVRHSERTPLVHTLVGPGMPDKWPLCKDQQPAAVAFLSGSSRQSKQLMNPYTRELETLHLDRKLEIPGGADGAFKTVSDHEQSLRTAPPLPPQDGPDAFVCQMGMLTDVGRNSAFRLGVRLRRLYVDRLGLLPQKLDSSAPPLYLRSTPFSRTIDTILHAYQGLYPIDTRGTTPLVLFRRDTKDENLYPPYWQCARLRQLHSSFKQVTGDAMRAENRSKKLDRDLDEILPQAFENSGIDPTDAAVPRVGLHPNSIDPTRLMDMVHTVEAHREAWGSLYLPKALRSCTTQKLLDRNTVRHWLNPYRLSNEARGLGVGLLLRDISERMVQRVEGAGPAAQTKLGMYGCHDSSIGAVMSSLGDHSRKWPPFTSTLAFELLRERNHASNTKAVKNSIGRRRMQDLREWETDHLDGHYIRVLYNNEPFVIPQCEQPGNHRPGDTSMCTLKAFKSIVDSMAPSNMAEACEPDALDLASPVWNPSRGKARMVDDSVGRADSK